jgi:hypothetical protein
MAPDSQRSRGGKRGKASQSTIATSSWAESLGCVNDGRMTFGNRAVPRETRTSGTIEWPEIVALTNFSHRFEG